jgi:hypothetical protein
MAFKGSPLGHRRIVWPCLVLAIVALIVALPWLPPPYQTTQVLLTAVGSLWALAFYIHGRHAEDAKFMKQLLSEFNARYDKLNDALQTAIWHGEPFTPEKKLCFIDYFNLCAEEWLFRQGGYIYDPVWTAWENGMKQYGKDERVWELWQKERATQSYYGFELPR